MYSITPITHIHFLPCCHNTPFTLIPLIKILLLLFQLFSPCTPLFLFILQLIARSIFLKHTSDVTHLLKASMVNAAELSNQEYLASPSNCFIASLLMSTVTWYFCLMFNHTSIAMLALQIRHVHPPKFFGPYFLYQNFIRSILCCILSLVLWCTFFLPEIQCQPKYGLSLFNLSLLFYPLLMLYTARLYYSLFPI